MESKILDVYWLTGISSIGIVAVENQGEVVFRIAQTKGDDLDKDIAYIKDHGMKFNIDGLVKWVKKIEKLCSGHPFDNMTSIFNHFNPIYEKVGYTCTDKAFELRKLVWSNDVHIITLLANHDCSKINISVE